jgi:hypothetical protein
MDISPAVHGAAIRALEGQQAAYQRYARRVESQRESLSRRHPDQLLHLARQAGADFEELEQGARDIRPALEAAREDSDPVRASELRHLLEAVHRDAARAEAQIHGLRQELERWRDEFGARLEDMGVELPGQAGSRGYGAEPQPKPVLIDRKG